MVDGREAYERLRTWGEEPGSVALLTDIDGTLAPIVPTPDMSEISDEIRDSLRATEQGVSPGRGHQREEDGGRTRAPGARRRRLLRQPRLRDPARRRGRGDPRGPALPGEDRGAGTACEGGTRPGGRLRRGEGHNGLRTLPQRGAGGRRAIRRVREERRGTPGTQDHGRPRRRRGASSHPGGQRHRRPHPGRGVSPEEGHVHGR